MASLMRFEVLAPDKYVLKSDAVSYVEAVTLWGVIGILPRQPHKKIQTKKLLEYIILHHCVSILLQ